MPQKYITKSHPTYAAILSRMKTGARNSELMAEFGVDRQVIFRIRKTAGIPSPARQVPTVADRVAQHVSGPDEGGHMTWSGSWIRDVPVVKDERNHPVYATRFLFEQRARRASVGHVMPECDTVRCVAPAHLSDAIERRNVRGQERLLYGLDPQPWDTCPAGKHPWDRFGRFAPDLSDYCGGCNTERAARMRRAASMKGTDR